MDYRRTITNKELENIEKIRPSITDNDGAYVIVYNPDRDDDQWVYLDENLTVVSFGIGDHIIKFDESLGRHYDEIDWLFSLGDNNEN